MPKKHIKLLSYLIMVSQTKITAEEETIAKHLKTVHFSDILSAKKDLIDYLFIFEK
jgi:hypothetical protein